MSAPRHGVPATTQPPGRRVRFWLDDAELEGREGMPLAVALWAAGVHDLGFQERHGAIRGLYCAIGHCFECRLTVDGVRDVRACLTPLREGLRAARQLPPPPLSAKPLEGTDGDA
jgi:sarcosine oxidase subunit alpha